ncbi:MAG: hypothetical protein KC593_00950 [Myxococcales bacterium]|nr:hypothetical protein [Myxococcales bacterium]
MKKSTVLGCVLALLGPLTQACGDGQRVPTFESGVPPETPLLGQSPAEEQAFCEEAMRYIDELYPLDLAQRGECMTGALVLGLIRGEPACEAEMTRCMSEIGDIPVTDLMCDVHDFSPYAGCDATVGEVEACANATAETVTRLVWPLGCEYAFELLARDEPAAEMDAAIAALRSGPCAPLGPSCPYFGVALDELADNLRDR